MDIREEIIGNLKKALADLGIEDVSISLERPKEEGHGDYSTNAVFTLFTNSKLKSPMDLAQEIAEILNTKYIIHDTDRIEAVAPGFINFRISKEALIANLNKAFEGKEYGKKPQDLSKKVVVEYSSPNIAKPFTVGHLRSTIIGSAIANLLEANGWKVYRDNHLGDWGTQFGKQIYAIKTWGNEEKIEKSENPVKELVALYIKFHEEAEKNPELEDKGREWFKKLETGDLEAKRLWKKCVDWSLKEFEKIYKTLGVSFTENNGLGYGESFFEDKISGVLEELKGKGLLKESEDAQLVFFEKDPSAGLRLRDSDSRSSGQAKYPPLMILKKDGATLYSTRDLATDKFRLEKYGKDIVVINEVGIEQTLYFRQLYEIEKMLGWYKEGQRIHIRHGHYRFKDEKMSTRKGNVIWLEEVLQEAVKRAKKLGSEGQKEVAEAVGIGAIKWNDLKRTSQLDIVFDWDEILNMEGNSGPYVQYAYVRTQSILNKVKSQVSFARRDLAKLEAEEVSLLRALNRFPETVAEAGEKFAPNLLCNYLFDLAQKFNLFYEKHKILESEQKDFRVLLTKSVGQVLKTGLNLLGIQAPIKM